MTQKKMQAVIMAGGEGSRLRPLTGNVPKPMLPVANKPLMGHILSLLQRHGFDDVVATVQFLSSVIRNYFGDGSDLGVTLSYATEEVPLGTAGSILGASDLLAGTFLVISGDALTDLDLSSAVDFHRSKGAAATLVLKRMKDPLEFGIVMTDEDGRIRRFLEKPTWGQVFTDTINTGIYILEPEVLDLIPPEEPYDFSSQLFPLMLDKGLPLFGYVTNEYWTDVGNAEAYLAAHRDVLTRKVAVDLDGFELHKDVWVGEDVEIHPQARLEGPVLIGDNSRIGAGARVGPLMSVGANVTIAEEARLGGGVILDRGVVGSYARVTGAVVGRGSVLDPGAILEEGAVLGDEVTIGAGAVVNPGVKIYSSRQVEAGAIVTHSIVHETRASRSLFGSRGVSGRISVGVTPETAVRLGQAYGTILKRGSVVVTGRDSSRAARTLKRALIAGLNSTGVTVHDLELVPGPLTRFTVRREQAVGGISVRTAPGDTEMVEIRLFGAEGADISEGEQRKIERVYFRGDYRRVGPARLGELEFPPRALEGYTTGLLRAVDQQSIRARAPKVVIDYAYGPASLVGPSLMGRLGCDALALHAFTDEHRPVLVTEDLERLLDELCSQVRNSGSDIGILVEPGGEVAHLVDDAGHLVTHGEALFAFLLHEVRAGAGNVALPVSCSDRYESLATAEGGAVTWTPTAPAALMARASRGDIGFAGNAEGALIFPAFMPAPDAMMTFCKALEMLAREERPLSRIVADLPPTYMTSIDVRTPWDLKGAAMRHVAASAPRERLVLLDGVKITEDHGWALVIPLGDAPFCRVWAEGDDPPAAAEIAQRYAALVEEVVG